MVNVMYRYLTSKIGPFYLSWVDPRNRIQWIVGHFFVIPAQAREEEVKRLRAEETQLRQEKSKLRSQEDDDTELATQVSF